MMSTLLTLGLGLSSAFAGELKPTSGGGLDAVYAPQRVAVLIGVDSYTDPALPDLRFAAKDARDLGRVLQSQEGGAFDRVYVVTGPEATSRAAIQRAIDSATADLQRDDTFVLYLSGHGTLTVDPAQGTRLWFLPTDGRLGDAPRTGLSVEWLETRVNEVEARRRVLILDTCHNGRDKSSLDPATASLLESMRGEPPAPRSLREVSESEARLYAAQYYQPAMEDKNLQNGVYTHFLIEALTLGAGKADLDRDGLVDVTEAHEYARDRTIHFTGGMQVPRAEYRIVGREEIYLAGSDATRSAAERALLAATDAVLNNTRVLIDGTSRGALPSLIAVEPGRHQLVLESDSGEVLLSRSLRVEAGETVMLTDLFPTGAPRWELSTTAALRQGPGLDTFSPWVGGVELGRRLETKPVARLRPELHLRGAVGTATMTVENLTLPAEVVGGELSVGGVAAFELRRVPLSLGPSLDAGLLWRSFPGYAGTERQGAPTVIPGARATLRLDAPQLDQGGLSQVVLRYEVRGLPFTVAEEPSYIVEQGLALGLSFGGR